MSLISPYRYSIADVISGLNPKVWIKPEGMAGGTPATSVANYGSAGAITLPTAPDVISRNSLNSLSFVDTSSEYLKITSPSGLTYYHTVYAVTEDKAAGSGFFHMESGVDVNSNPGFYHGGVGNGTMGVNNGTLNRTVGCTGLGGMVGRRRLVVSGYGGASNLWSRVDGIETNHDVTGTGDPADAAATGDLYIGSRAGSSQFCNGYLWELLVFAGFHDAATVAVVENYLNTRHNCYPAARPNGTDLVYWNSFYQIGSNEQPLVGPATNTSSDTPTTTGMDGTGVGISANGTSQDFKTNADIVYGSTQVITVCCWVKFANPTSLDGILWESGTNLPSQDNAFLAYKNAATLLLTVWQTPTGGDKYRQRSFAIPNDSNWHHYAVVYDASTITGDIKLYRNGTLQSLTNVANTRTAAHNIDDKVLCCFARNATSGSAALFLGASFDDMRIFKRELTQAEITALQTHKR